MRLYAIGDIHGCLPLLQNLLEKIEEDCKGSDATVRKIFLGDYIDRGLYSRQTIDYLLNWGGKEKYPPIFLLGNHEQVMRKIMRDHDVEKLIDWLHFGGRETLQSYGISMHRFAQDLPALVDSLIEKVPQDHVEFLEKLNLSADFGDYFFCHAGVRPGSAIDDQDEEDLLWIRNQFLDYRGSFGKVVVHGHSISREVEFQSNRIGIDTGAYATNRLTALALEGTKQWLIQTV